MNSHVIGQLADIRDELVAEAANQRRTGASRRKPRHGGGDADPATPANDGRPARATATGSPSSTVKHAMNGVRHRPHRESIAGRFDAEADALQAVLAGGMTRECHAHRIDLDRRPAGDGRTCVRVQPRATSSDDPIGRRAPIDLPCQRHDPDLWFADAPADLQLAKALCADCPARLACLTGAAARQEPTGVWGGQIFDHGRIITHKRPRGRPRKDSTPPRSHRVLPADVSGPHSSGPGRLAVLACRDSDLDIPDLADHRVRADIDQIALNVAAATLPGTAPRRARPTSLTH